MNDKMTEKEKYVFEVFQKVAGGYDNANKRISLGTHMRWKRISVRYLCRHISTQKPLILDIGCGTGDMLKLLNNEIPDAKITGVDFSPNMLKEAEKNCSYIRNLELIRANASHLPFEDDTYDGVTISFALRNTDDYDRTMKEIYRVLKPGGMVMCIDSFVPSSKLVRPFYNIYFSKIMPLLGGGFSRKKEYEWLNESTKSFVSVKELAKRMYRIGYRNIKKKSFLYGASESIVGRKTC